MCFTSSPRCKGAAWLPGVLRGLFTCCYVVARCWLFLWHIQVTKVKFEILCNDIDQAIVSLLSEFSKLQFVFLRNKKVSKWAFVFMNILEMFFTFWCFHAEFISKFAYYVDGTSDWLEKLNHTSTNKHTQQTGQFEVSFMSVTQTTA